VIKLNTYKAHFSFYSEESGEFQETVVNVESANQFEARTAAWEWLNRNEDMMKFASCVKLCGITWEASKLDLQDYFNAEAAHCKYMLKYIDNVEKPNTQITKKEDAFEKYERQKHEYYGSLYTVSNIAADFGKPLGIIPPALYEELHYAREFLNVIDVHDYDKYSSFAKLIERAEKWDSSACFNIRELFQRGYAAANGHEFDFSAQFYQGGVYPVYAKPFDYESKYIRRRTSAKEYKTLRSLPFFDENDIIPNSNTIRYEWHTLVINKEALPPEKQVPVNSIWTVSPTNEYNQNSDCITVENPFTGETAKHQRSDFLGVLLPERYAGIDFESVKSELAHAKTAEKPSVLKAVEENKQKIAQAERSNKQENQRHGNVGIGD
jgi:hypothetical protein